MQCWESGRIYTESDSYYFELIWKFKKISYIQSKRRITVTSWYHLKRNNPPNFPVQLIKAKKEIKV